jgi:peptide/nickel transport system permease protein
MNGTRSRTYRVFLANKASLFGAVVIAWIVIVGIGAPWVAPYDPNVQDIPHRLAGPTLAHPLGTDQYGRDIFSRVIYGARISLFIGVLSVLVGMSCGTVLGLVAGYWRGVVDLIICKIVDVLMSFPMLLLAMAVVAILGTSMTNSILAVGIASVPRFARLARGQALALKNSEYIVAVRALGSNPLRILVFHLLPNILSPIVIMGTLYLATAIIMEANLSFLGLGVQPPTATWGAMVSDGREFLRSAPWVCAFPGTAIAITVLAFNMLGDALRDALDRRLLA